jgi:PhnB protein
MADEQELKKAKLQDEGSTLKTSAVTAIIPYLTFTGNCRNAIEFYAKVFDAETPDIKTFAEAPGSDKAEESHNAKIMHATVKFGGQTLFLSDSNDVTKLEIGHNIALSLSFNDEIKAAAIAEALAEHGKVIVAFSKQFWGDYFGLVEDQFSIRWMINSAVNT